MPEILNAMPRSIVQATTVKIYVDKSSEGITPTDYDLVYTFSDGTESESVTATDNGDGRFLLTLDSNTTASLPVQKDIPYTAYASHSTNGEAYVVDRGVIVIEPNLVFDPTQDTRSHVKKVLDQLEAVIEGRMAQSDASYSIGTGAIQRSISKLSPDELIQAHRYYGRLYKKERQRERLRKGKPAKKVFGRF